MGGRRTAAAISLLALAGAALGACSDDDDAGTATTDGGGGVTVTTTEAGEAVAVEAGEVSDTEQYLTAEPDGVAAGAVTFTLTNAGTVEHEMLVMRTDTPADEIPIGTDDRVSEDDSLGEIPETAPGATGTLTLTLEPGAYVLLCNVAEHYGKGMFTAFTVTG